MPRLMAVKPKAILLWPAELYDELRPENHPKVGWREYMRRKLERRVRGEAGYVVDVDAPGEGFFCKGQGSCLVPVAETVEDKRTAPKKATPIDFEPALKYIDRVSAEAVANESEVAITVDDEPEDDADLFEESEGEAVAPQGP
jgi:hypothetical protein